MSSLDPVSGSAAEILELLREWDAAHDAPPLSVETSGSTGRPQRVVLSRSAMRASADATHARLGGPGQWLLALPPSYVAGLQVLFRSVRGGTSPVSSADDLTHGRRYVSLVPTQLSRMLPTDELRRFDTVLVGGAALDAGLRRRAEESGVRVVETYGMSETCGGCVYDGIPLDGVKVDVADTGRVRIGGPVLFDGYDGQPELTAQVLQDGWFLTSDFGRLDEDGRLQVLGRVDDVVISGGVNVPTAVVAARVREHADVRSAEVVGAHDPEWGQRVVAVVVTRKALDPSEIRSFVSERLPREWAPMQVVVVDEIPLLGNGKVDRLRLGELAEAGTTVEDLR